MCDYYDYYYCYYNYSTEPYLYKQFFLSRVSLWNETRTYSTRQFSDKKKV